MWDRGSDSQPPLLTESVEKVDSGKWGLVWGELSMSGWVASLRMMMSSRGVTYIA